MTPEERLRAAAIILRDAAEEVRSTRETGIGRTLRMLREEAGVSIDELAALADLAPAALEAIEAGELVPSRSVAARLTAAVASHITGQASRPSEAALDWAGEILAIIERNLAERTQRAEVSDADLEHL